MDFECQNTIFKILFWHSNWDRISYFDIQNPIFTFELGPNIVLWHSKSYFDNRNRDEYLILIFKISKSYFDIRTWAEYRILTFKILFLHSKWVEYRIWTFKILIWHSKSGRISYYDVQSPILTFELESNIVFWHSKSYFEYQNTIFGLISNVKIRFWKSKSVVRWTDHPAMTIAVDLGRKATKQTNINSIFGPSLNALIGFWVLKYDIRLNFECQNKILNVKIR